ncbi:hypothetical protein VTH06DRAFT_5379 [Thermothelomyces fergusii]
MATLLDQLRTLSSVDCDTLDAQVAEQFGPFVDCTSNQAIAFAELSKVDSDGKPFYKQLISESIKLARSQFGKQADATLEELAVELMMVSLALRMAPHTTGHVHVQTNPNLAYSANKTVRNAERIISHFKQLAPDFDTSRVCIKIPSTWEGLQACRELEKKGIATLATTLFSLEQTALAADAGCRYVAPYVNELRVHFDPGYTDPDPALAFTRLAQAYLDSLPDGSHTDGGSNGSGKRTQVVAASLTSIDEAMQLAGVHHITIPPGLLSELACTPAASWPGASTKAVGATDAVSPPAPEVRRGLEAVVRDEALWRMAFTRAEGGKCEGKLAQALSIFASMQERLEEIVRRAERGEEGAEDSLEMPFWPLNNLIHGTPRKGASDALDPVSKGRKAAVSFAPSPPPTDKANSTNINTGTASNNSITTTSPLKDVAPASRWNPAISPDAPEFAAVLATFRRLLGDPSQTVDSILAAHFTRHEQDLLRPSCCDDDYDDDTRRHRHHCAALARIRDDNRRLYAELLRSDRFAARGWAARADLAFKLALAWFGVPVAPMGAGVADAVAIAEREEEEEEEEEAMAMAMARRTGDGGELRFLNGYTERFYGRDAGVRKPDPRMEAYYFRDDPKAEPAHHPLHLSLNLGGGEAGHGRDNARFCPWCGIQLADAFDARLRHVDGCARKPFPAAEGPIDAERRAYFLPEPGRSSPARDPTGAQDGKRRRNGGAVEEAGEAGRRSPAKKIKVDGPPPSRTRKRREGRAGERSDSPLSSPLSSSHSKRSAEPWRPSVRVTVPPARPRTRGEIAREPDGSPVSSPPSSSHSKRWAEAWLPPPKQAARPPAPATPVSAKPKTAGKGGKAKGQTRGGQGQKATATATTTPARAGTGKAKAASARKTATATTAKPPGDDAPAPATRTRSRTRAAAAAATDAE